MHRTKKLLAAVSAALAISGGTLAVATSSAHAAATLSVTLSASGAGASAIWDSAGDPALIVGVSTSSAQIQVNNPASAAPTTEPTFATTNHSADTGTSPRWVIQFAGGDTLYGFPWLTGSPNWEILAGACHTSAVVSTYAAALATINGESCGGNVSSARIVADGSQGVGATDTITGISYDGLTLPTGADVVTVTNPGTQTNSVGTAITTLQIAASSNKGDAIASYAETGLPAGLSLDTTSGKITGTPTTAGDNSVQVTATDNGGTKGTVTFAWNIGGGSSTTTYSGGIRLYKMGLCLDDRYNSSTPGSAVVQVWRCNGLPNQQWQVMSNGTIQHNGLCLDARGAGTRSGTKIDLYTCNGHANQQWDTKGWRIHYDNPSAVNQVVDDTAFGGGGTQQEIYSDNGGANQVWATF